MNMTPTPYIRLLDAAGNSTIDSQMEFQAPAPAPELLSTPPKLSLYSLPSKPPPDGLTPPLNTVATIPFLWEEAPGKPRPTQSHDPPNSKTVVRSLDLPPRLTPMNNGTHVGIEVIPSPTTVLSGPYNEPGSKTLLESPVIISSKHNKGKMRMPLRKLMRKDRSPAVKFSSWRWDSFKDIDRVERSPSLKFCSWRWDSFRDIGGGGSLSCSFDDRQKSVDSNNKIGKVTKKNSFTFAAADGANTSSFLTNMFGTFKKAMPWRSRRSRR